MLKEKKVSFLNNHNYLLMRCMCLSGMHTFSSFGIRLDVIGVTGLIPYSTMTSPKLRVLNSLRSPIWRRDCRDGEKPLLT